jgi:hypothetical protein
MFVTRSCFNYHHRCHQHKIVALVTNINYPSDRKVRSGLWIIYSDGYIVFA